MDYSIGVALALIRVDHAHGQPGQGAISADELVKIVLDIDSIGSVEEMVAQYRTTIGHTWGRPLPEWFVRGHVQWLSNHEAPVLYDLNHFAGELLSVHGDRLAEQNREHLRARIGHMLDTKQPGGHVVVFTATAHSSGFAVAEVRPDDE